jgi:hypothetical protein
MLINSIRGRMSEETTQSTQTTPKPKIEHKRGEDFIDRYANNVFFEGSIWDLKVVFGSLDQSIGPNYVTQHTGVSLSWTQVKLLAYLLRFQLVAHEARMGKVNVPKGIINAIPAEPPESIATFLGTSSDDLAAYQKARKLYEEFVAENPEAVDDPDLPPSASPGN